ncbi:MAG TPA: sigma-70 family RNA polymerase sigma factor [Candidatus Binatia bacterium]|nr:sigma-70 family RNA polymerase sigma factor [Candidatus Binatia bacterium]
MTDQERDRLCVERMRAGDTRALEELYDRHNGLLYSVVLRIVRSPGDAEEVLRETWLQICRGTATYNASRGTVGAWLATAARNQSIDRLRREGAGAAAGVDAPHPTEDASANAAHRQMSERVGRALEKLGPQHWQVVELAYFGGLTQGEIGERLNTPPGTVRSWTRQALLRLSELVPQEEWA